MLRRIALLVFALLPLVAAAQPHVYLDRSLRSGAPEKTVVIISPDVEVSEISAGGVIQKVAAWSENARTYVTEALKHLAAEDKFKVASLPRLSADEQASLGQHVALADTGALHDPLVIGIHQLFQILIRDDLGRDVRSKRRNLGAAAHNRANGEAQGTSPCGAKLAQ